MSAQSTRMLATILLFSIYKNIWCDSWKWFFYWPLRFQNKRGIAYLRQQCQLFLVILCLSDPAKQAGLWTVGRFIFWQVTSTTITRPVTKKSVLRSRGHYFMTFTRALDNLCLYHEQCQRLTFDIFWPITRMSNDRVLQCLGHLEVLIEMFILAGPWIQWPILNLISDLLQKPALW